MNKTLSCKLTALYLCIYALNTFCTDKFSINPKITEEGPEKQRITITINPGDSWLYKDSIRFSVDHPDISLSSWQTDKEAVNRYDTTYRNTKKVFVEPINITVIAKSNYVTKPISGYLHMAYELKGNPATELRVPLNFHSEKRAHDTGCLTMQATKQTESVTTPAIVTEPFSLTNYTSLLSNWSTKLSTILKTTESLPVRLLLVFFLGILLSLTPCIYPMIPITVGILQAHGKCSFWYNLLMAISYTCGLATTFACFGLAASCLGPLCGKLLMHPIFVVLIVALLAYLAFSLFDWYELYTPSFFKTSGSSPTNGSLLSTFLFGAASGTFASPCVSPGLALLLTIVANMGSMLMGFLLLFVFGVGLSMPLLIVGTISGSISIMPKAGGWMIEIKKMFGFLLLAMCFYYLKNVIPWYIILWLMCAFVFFVGIYYLMNASKITNGLKRLYNFLGVVLVSWSIVLAAQAAQETFYGRFMQTESFWLTSYEQALTQAQQENKKVFIDFWATYCAICIAINNTTLTQPALVKALNDTTVALKVDGSYDSNQPYHELKTKYDIKGFPTFLLIDPETETVIRRWGSEIYNKPIDEVIKELS